MILRMSLKYREKVHGSEDTYKIIYYALQSCSDLVDLKNHISLKINCPIHIIPPFNARQKIKQFVTETIHITLSITVDYSAHPFLTDILFFILAVNDYFGKENCFRVRPIFFPPLPLHLIRKKSSCPSSCFIYNNPSISFPSALPS